MSDKRLVTVITPTYNHEAFIGECIDSILDQSYENWEMFVVDDGSSDGTWNKVRMYANCDSRIKAVRQENKGIWRISEAYNLALHSSKGDYIAILEGDDFWPPGKLERQVAVHDPDVLLSYGDTMAVTRARKPLHLLNRPPFIGAVDSPTFLKFLLCRESSIQPVSALCNANALREIGGFHQDSFPAVDYPTFVRLAQLPGRVVFEPCLFGYWRQHDAQVTARKGVELIEGRLRISLEQYVLLDECTREQLLLSEKAIIDSHSAGLADSYLNAVRDALKEKNRQSLWYPLKRLWRYGGVRRKAQAIYALLAINLGWDMEWILDAYLILERAWTGRR